MSGRIIAQALEAHFDAVRCAELKRLERKLSDLSPTDRDSAESIINEVIGTLVRTPAAALADADQSDALDAIVRLFALECTGAAPLVSERYANNQLPPLRGEIFEQTERGA
jgi:hypothetical protein